MICLIALAFSKNNRENVIGGSNFNASFNTSYFLAHEVSVRSYNKTYIVGVDNTGVIPKFGIPDI